MKPSTMARRFLAWHARKGDPIRGAFDRWAAARGLSVADRASVWRAVEDELTARDLEELGGVA